ncbi:MAG: tetratricopeptide repeat protein [Calditrichaeota bacterium]|nr:MAG: tetratricopeptide repeat protein [Calditrichota bacterium]MBL1207292.1 tetratricopeptide repeat protein [Calditrichota bacterium]NOG47124.1 tetratricopeptide repeat protein [Calditrichota bacterium]
MKKVFNDLLKTLEKVQISEDNRQLIKRQLTKVDEGTCSKTYFNNVNSRFKKYKKFSFYLTILGIVISIYSVVITIYGSPFEWKREAIINKEKLINYEYAQEKASKGDYISAIEFIKTGLNVGLPDETGRFLLQRYMVFQALRNNFDTSDDLDFVEFLLRLNPKDYEARLNRAILYFFHADYKNSLEDCNYVITELGKVENLNRRQVQWLSDALSNASLSYTILGRFDSVNNCADKLFDLGRVYKIESIIAEAELQVGMIRKAESKYESATHNFETALRIFRKEKNQKGQFNALLELGKLHIDIGNHDQALSNLNEARQISKKMKSQRSEVLSLEYIGSALAKQCKFEEAISLYEDLYKIHSKTGDVQEIADILIHRGNLFLFTENFIESKKALDESVAILRGINSPINLAIALNSQGAAMIGLKYRNSNVPLLEAKEIFSKHNIIFGVLNCDLNMGIYQQDVLKQPEHAIKTFREILIKIPDSAGSFKAGVFGQLGLAFMEIEKLNEAKESLNEAITLSGNDECLKKQFRDDLAKLTNL